MLGKPLPKKKARQAKIVTELQIRPQMKVNELADRLDVSQETIRRDLAALAEQGKISRTFGGAVGISAMVPSVNERQALMIAERDRISEMAASLIEPHDLLMVGGGSTTLRFALRIAAIEFPITVVTHSIPFAMSVSKNKFVSVEILPGKLNPDEGLTCGSNTLAAIRKFSAHKAFVGASGLNERGLHALLEPGEVYAALIESAEKAYILVDSAKFGATALAQYRGWDAKLTLIADKLPDEGIRSALEKASVPIIVA